MIDFRYHLVSLVSVFLALAVGIVLGAGPLKDQIGTTLTEQVSSLRQSRDDLRTQLETSQTGNTHRDQFVKDLIPSTVAGKLSGRGVVLVSLPGADSGTADSVAEALGSAGASVTGRVSVRQEWTDADQAENRAKVLDAQKGTLGGAGAEASGNSGLSALLARALVARTTPVATQADPDATAVLDALSKANLVDVDGDVASRATGAIVIGPPVETSTSSNATASATASPTEGEITDAWSGITQALDAADAGTVVLGPPSSASGDGVVATVRGDSAVAKLVSTVDLGGTSMGDLASVLALDEQLDGASGSYGFGDRATAPLPDLGS